MLYVALAEAAALILLVAAFSSLVRSMQRSHTRREDQLLNKVLHAFGSPWEEAPADEARNGRREEAAAVSSRDWTTNPEQEF